MCAVTLLKCSVVRHPDEVMGAVVMSRPSPPAHAGGTTTRLQGQWRLRQAQEHLHVVEVVSIAFRGPLYLLVTCDCFVAPGLPFTG